MEVEACFGLRLSIRLAGKHLSSEAMSVSDYSLSIKEDTGGLPMQMAGKWGLRCEGC